MTRRDIGRLNREEARKRGWTRAEVTRGARSSVPLTPP